MFKKLFARYSKKTAIAIIALSLVLAVGITGTLAFLVVKTAELINTFNPGTITLTVNDSNVSNSSDSDAAAYIRVAVVVNYQDESGNVWREAAVEGTDFSVSDVSDKWLKGSDGYYYYKKPVDANDATEDLPVTVTKLSPVDENGNSLIPVGKNIVATFLATGVQVAPTTAVTESWNVTLDANGVIITVP